MFSGNVVLSESHEIMPLTKKGKKILGSMKESYGSKKAEQVFYASKNKGSIKGVDKKHGGMTKHRGKSKRWTTVKNVNMDAIVQMGVVARLVNARIVTVKKRNNAGYITK